MSLLSHAEDERHTATRRLAEDDTRRRRLRGCNGYIAVTSVIFFFMWVDLQQQQQGANRAPWDRCVATYGPRTMTMCLTYITAKI